MMKLSLLFLVLMSSRSSAAISGNLALLKVATQSSNYESPTKAQRAIDGDITTNSYRHVALTGLPANGDVNPFWRVDLNDVYLVQTVELVRRLDCCLDEFETMEVRVGTNLENEGNSNPLCGEPVDMNGMTAGHTFRCELIGRYVNVKKTNIPVAYPLALFEVIVNQEPTSNIALGKPTLSSSRYSTSTKSERAVDGNFLGNFNTASSDASPWLMIDFQTTMPVVKMFIATRTGSVRFRERLEKIVIRIGDSSVDNGKHNPRFGKVHDLSVSVCMNLYMEPVRYGRYVRLESLKAEQMNIMEVEFYSECRPYIAERSNGLGGREVTIFNNHSATLRCRGHGNPKPYVAWVFNGVVLQNRTTNTDLVLSKNLTKGSTLKYECWATNIHGKDYYEVTVTVEGRYDMCLRPVEINDSSRALFASKQQPKSDANAFSNAVYKFHNPEDRTSLKMMTSCPPPASCNTDAPGWMNGSHPKPEDGLVRRTVCFHYDGDCCYESLDILVMNCPGMFVYKLLNTPFPFLARYCFENDRNDEAFVPFKSLPLVFTILGGSNTALVNHVIASDDGIDDSSKCLFLCMMNKCRSFNYAKVEKVCEVSDATKDDFPLHLATKQGFQYYHPVATTIVL